MPKPIDVSEMPDVDIAEMVADWEAMSQELGTNTAREWYEKNVLGKKGRWIFSEEQKQLIDKLLKLFDKKEEMASRRFVGVQTKDLTFGTFIILKPDAEPECASAEVPRKYVEDRGLWAVDQVEEGDPTMVNINRVETPYPGAYCSWISIDEIDSIMPKGDKIATRKFAQEEKYIMLYHGTSSVFLPQIQEEGLKSPDYQKVYDDVMSEAEKIVDLTKVPEFQLQRVKDRFEARKGTGVFLISSEEGAEGYASRMGRQGGEFLWEMVHYLGGYGGREFQKKVLGKFRESKPIVLKIKCPVSRLSSGDKNIFEQLLNHGYLEEVESDVYKDKAEHGAWEVMLPQIESQYVVDYKDVEPTGPMMGSKESDLKSFLSEGVWFDSYSSDGVLKILVVDKDGNAKKYEFVSVGQETADEFKDILKSDRKHGGRGFKALKWIEKRFGGGDRVASRKFISQMAVIAYIGLDIGEAELAASNGNLVSISDTFLLDDPEVVNYLKTQYRFKDDELTIDWNIREGVTLFNDKNLAKKQGEVVIEVRVEGMNKQFGPYTVAKDPKKCKIMTIWYEEKQFTPEGFLGYVKGKPQGVEMAKEESKKVAQEEMIEEEQLTCPELTKFMQELGFQEDIIMDVEEEESDDKLTKKVKINTSRFEEVPFLKGGKILSVLQAFADRLPQEWEGKKLEWLFVPNEELEKETETSSDAITVTISGKREAAIKEIIRYSPGVRKVIRDDGKINWQLGTARNKLTISPITSGNNKGKFWYTCRRGLSSDADRMLASKDEVIEWLNSEIQGWKRTLAETKDKSTVRYAENYISSVEQVIQDIKEYEFPIYEDVLSKKTASEPVDEAKDSQGNIFKVGEYVKVPDGRVGTVATIRKGKLQYKDVYWITVDFLGTKDYYLGFASDVIKTKQEDIPKVEPKKEEPKKEKIPEEIKNVWSLYKRKRWIDEKEPEIYIPTKEEIEQYAHASIKVGVSKKEVIDRLIIIRNKFTNDVDKLQVSNLIKDIEKEGITDSVKVKAGRIKFRIISDSPEFPKFISVPDVDKQSMHDYIYERLNKQTAYWNLNIDFENKIIQPEMKKPFFISAVKTASPGVGEARLLNSAFDRVGEEAMKSGLIDVAAAYWIGKHIVNKFKRDDKERKPFWSSKDKKE